jgi:hypothetical protein
VPGVRSRHTRETCPGRSLLAPKRFSTILPVRYACASGSSPRPYPPPTQSSMRGRRGCQECPGVRGPVPAPGWATARRLVGCPLTFTDSSTASGGAGTRPRYVDTALAVCNMRRYRFARSGRLHVIAKAGPVGPRGGMTRVQIHVRAGRKSMPVPDRAMPVMLRRPFPPGRRGRWLRSSARGMPVSVLARRPSR